MSNAQLTISFHNSLSFANLERVCISFWHHSRISSSHSLFGLPLFPFPSIDPSITLFIFRSFSIQHTCPNRLSFLLITTCTRSSLTSSLLISLFLILSKRFTCNIHLLQYISKTNNAVLSAFLNVHVSHAYSATLNTQALTKSIMVLYLISLLLHISPNPAITPFALLILALMSFEQSLSHVRTLPRDTNSFTFSILLFSTSICCSMSSFPKIIVFVFSMLILNPASIPASLSSLTLFCNATQLSSNRSISSANRKLFIISPCTDIPVPLS